MNDAIPVTTIPRQRTPWWACLIAVSFLSLFGSALHNSLMGIEGPGVATSDAPSGGAVIEKVGAGKPMEKAGVRAGDIVVAVDGQAIRGGHDWGEMTWQFEPEKPFLLTVERDGREMHLTLTFTQRRLWELRDREQWLDYFLSVALAFLYLAMGLVALFARPRDPGAVAGAVLLVMFAGLLGPGGGVGTAAMFRQSPFLLQLPKFVFAALLGGYLVLVFAALYPRPVFRRRWVLPLMLVPALLVIPNNAIRFYHRFYMPEQAISPGPPWAFQLQLAVEVANILAGLIVLGLGYRRLMETQERRSMRKVLLGALISFGAMMFYFWLLSSESSSPILRQVYESKATDFVLLVLWSVFPVVFAQSVLRTDSRLAIADSQ